MNTINEYDERVVKERKTISTQSKFYEETKTTAAVMTGDSGGEGGNEYHLNAKAVVPTESDMAHRKCVGERKDSIPILTSFFC